MSLSLSVLDQLLINKIDKLEKTYISHILIKLETIEKRLDKIEKIQNELNIEKKVVVKKPKKKVVQEEKGWQTVTRKKNSAKRLMER